MKSRKLTVDSVAKENLDDVIVIKMNSLDQHSKKQKIKLFKKNGEVLVGNDVEEYGVVEEIKKALPFIKEIKAESIFDGVIAPSGWNYVNVGDNLFISDEIYEAFKKELEDVKSPIEAMNIWKHKLEKIIREMNRPKIKNGLTEIVFILDRSGSMSGLEKDVVGGFNATINKQKLEPGRAIVSTVLFDHETEIIHDRVPLEKVKMMTEKDYQVRGTTALLDALGGAIRHIANVHKYGRAEDIPENTIFVINTDGYENASKRFTNSRVRSMIKYQTEVEGWEFVFLAANIDVQAAAREYGIREDMAVQYECSAEGVERNYKMLSNAISCARNRVDLSEGSWKKE